ncbi:MAG: D-TA family PLP-dependent enzyme [Gemmataceae bacterium]|nr:D-TA family PLP-dependent enzyme [Gemmataceae bacterium]
MASNYRLSDPESVPSPALLFFKDVIGRNIQRMIERAGGPSRLRPHCKTHKTREIVQLQLAAGVTKHKCATIAEAEMLAGVGVPDVLLAYPLVGPNCARLAKLVAQFPATSFATIADHARGVQQLSDALSAAGRRVPVLLDIDVGQHRTGVPPGDAAVALYEQIGRANGLVPGGLHVYDGHNHQESLVDRRVAVTGFFEQVLTLRDVLHKKGLPVPRLVLGGTPTFPVYAELTATFTDCELSPGTCVLNDHGYGSKFRDLCDLEPAALLLTRVVSRPTATRVTFDLGYKAVASDPPAGKRLVLLDFPPHEPVLHNEEHYVVECAEADRYVPGDVAYALPTHICPTSALHRFAQVVVEGRVVDQWEIVARDRMLTI